MRLARMPHALLCLILLGLMAGCGGTGAVVPDTNPDEAVSSVSARGRIITQSLMATWSVDELDTTLSAYSPAHPGTKPELPEPSLFPRSPSWHCRSPVISTQRQ